MPRPVGRSVQCATNRIPVPTMKDCLSDHPSYWSSSLGTHCSDCALDRIQHPNQCVAAGNDDVAAVAGDVIDKYAACSHSAASQLAQVPRIRERKVAAAARRDSDAMSS